MPIETICQGCARKLRVEDQFAGRQARCPHCRRVYTVPELIDSDESEPRGATEEPWRVRTEDGQEYGPVSKAELDQWAAEGRITAETSLRRGDSSAWQAAGSYYPQLSPAAEKANPFASSESDASGNPYQASIGESSPILIPHRGGTLLTLGIVGLLCCQICSPIAWAMGHSDMQAINAGRMNPEGRGLTQAGMILGIIGTAMMLFAVGAQVLLMLFAMLG